MPCGIYAIHNKVNDKLYIGQSVDIESRYKKHCRELRSNKHYNQNSLRSYKLYGEEAFELIVLELCMRNDLTFNEQKWINKYNHNNLYNMIFNVQQPLQSPFLGKHHTDEAKLKMSLLRKGKYTGEDNPNFGNKWSDDARLDMTLTSKFNVSRNVITRISNGTRWTNVTGGPIIPIVKENGKRIFSELHCKRIGLGHKNKMRQARIGKPGHKHSLETRRKISESHKKRNGG